MSDIRTISTAGPIGLDFDWALGRGAMLTDEGMETAVINSLFLDRVAAADDELPDDSGDRAGWWGDMAIEGDEPDPIGSRLWLLARAKATRETAARAQRYALEALEWFKTDGVADEVTAVAEYVSREQLKLTITIIRQVAGKPVNHRYDYVWNPSQPAPFVPLLPPILVTEGGDMLVTEDGTPITIF